MRVWVPKGYEDSAARLLAGKGYTLVSGNWPWFGCGFEIDDACDDVLP